MSAVCLQSGIISNIMIAGGIKDRAGQSSIDALVLFLFTIQNGGVNGVPFYHIADGQSEIGAKSRDSGNNLLVDSLLVLAGAVADDGKAGRLI